MTPFLPLSDDSPSTSHANSWILFISGPAASGKTSIAKFLASKLDVDFIEGDDLHPKANIDKMHKGESLTDSDRQGWLDAISEQASGYEKEQIDRRHLIVTCSALKQSYRDLLRESCTKAGYSMVHFIHLDAPESELRHRAETREGHFAKSDLVHGQFEALERPSITESDATIVSVVPPRGEVESEALDVVLGVLGRKGS